MWLLKAILSQCGQWTGLHSVVHYLWLITSAFVLQCSAPFAQINSTLTLSCLESVLRGPQLVTKVKASFIAEPEVINCLFHEFAVVESCIIYIPLSTIGDVCFRWLVVASATSHQLRHSLCSGND